MYLSPVEGKSKLDAHSGLVSPDNDDLGHTKSTPLLLEGYSTRKITEDPIPSPAPLLNNHVSRSTKCLRGSALSPEAILGKREDSAAMSSSSFTDILESRNLEMDQAWMETQKSTFTNWLNDRLKGGRQVLPRVQDLSEDLRDGTLLIKLLENLTKKKIKGYTKHPKTSAHELVNLDLVMEFMKKEGIKLIGIGSVNIFEGNVKLILGMLWRLIQKYQLRMKGYKVSTKDVLLRWVQALIPSWNVSNFTSDWRDGRVLMAMINAVKPGIAPNVATLDPTKHCNNCTLAIKIANAHLKIPKIISPDNLSSSNIDELSMMTYISYFVEPARVKLLRWIKKALRHLGITNFTSNWQDGRSFSALINSCFPGTMPHWMKMSGKNAAKNVAEFHDICSKKLGIQPHFSISDLSNGVAEELQIMTLIMQIQNSNLKPLPGSVVVNGPGLKKAEIGRETFFLIDTTDAGPGRLFIDAYYEEGKKLNLQLQEQLTGVLTFTYTPPSPGKINFEIYWSDVHVPESPFSIHVTDSHLIHIVDYINHTNLRTVGKAIELKLNAKQSGTGNLSAFLEYTNGGEKVEAHVTLLGESIAKLEYTPPKPGEASLHVFLNNKEATHLSITYTIVDSGGYVMDTFPENRVYYTFEEAEFSIISSKNLPLDVLQMTAIISSDIQIPIKFKSIEGNKGFANFKPTLPGAYKVEIVCIDQYIQGSPFNVEVSDPLNCKIHGKIPSSLQLGKPYLFELDTKEAGVGSISFECVDKDTSEFFAVSVKPHNVGEHCKQLEVVPNTEGEYLVGIKYQNHWIASSPFRIQVCDPTRFIVSGDLVESKMGMIGKSVRFKITSPCAMGEGLTPVISAIGPTAKYPIKMRFSESKCAQKVTFTPYEVGTHEVSVTYGGFHVPLSPFLLAVMTLESNACSATGLGLQEAFTNIPAQFVILAKTAGLVEEGVLQVKVTGVVNKVECKVRIRDNDSGLYNVAYILTTPGAYLISILAAGEHIAGSPFKLNAQPGPNPERCKMSGAALQEDAILTIGKPIDFSVDASKGGTGKLNVKATGPNGIQARVFIAKTKSRGVFDIKIDPIRHGKYRINIKWSDQHIPNSPFILRIYPGVDASKCLAYGPGLENGVVGVPTSFTVETRDAGPGTLRMCLHGMKDAFKIDIKQKDAKNVRTLIARYYPKKPGDYLVSIVWSDQHIPGSPFKVKITGEAMEDDFRPNKYKPTIPRIEELQVIREETEDDEDDCMFLDTTSLVSRIENNRPLSKVQTSSASLDETGIPMFGTASLKQGYNDIFVTNEGPRKPHKNSKSLSHLKPDNMMTFSGLHQLQKHKRSATSPSKLELKGQTGKFYGQATLNMDKLGK